MIDIHKLEKLLNEKIKEINGSDFIVMNTMIDDWEFEELLNQCKS